MHGEPLQRTFTVANPHGLHMRPLQEFVEAALKFQSDVFVSREGGEKLNGKSILWLMGLAAEQGTRLILEVNGPDAAEAMSTLLDVLAKTAAEKSEYDGN